MPSKYYNPTDPVSIVPLAEYNMEAARAALEAALLPIGGLDMVTEGMTVIIKANLVSAMKPEEAATTHPVLLSVLTEMLVERGAKVIIGDSPGGLYNSMHLSKVYNATGLHECEKYGALLNMDFGEGTAHFEDAKVCNTFAYTTYLDRADLIINFCKLKSHGMMGMSCAAKNIFGVIPGVIKPEYHYRFPSYEEFADMLLDLDEYFHPTISIADAVVGMEGNGPTAGTPREMGCIIASRSPHTLDTVAAEILGFERSELPILDAAYRRGIAPESFAEVKLFGSVDALRLLDFERVVERRSLEFSGDGKSGIKRLFGSIAGAILRTRPKVKRNMCVGCGVCADICPAKTIVIKNKKAVINKGGCIRCFCCQEFCPKSAIKVHRTPLAKLFHSEKRSGEKK